MSGLDFTFFFTVCHGGLLGLLIAQALYSFCRLIRNIVTRLSLGVGKLEGYRIVTIFLMVGFSLLLVWIRSVSFQAPEFSSENINHLVFLVSTVLTALFILARNVVPNAGRRSMITYCLIAVVFVGIYVWHIGETKARILNPIRAQLNKMPMPSDAKFICRKYEGCIPGLNAEVNSLYVTHLSPEETCKFLRQHLQQAGWYIYGFRSDGSPDPSGRYPGFGFVARWPFPAADPQKLQYLVSTCDSATASTMGFDGPEKNKCLPKAKSLAGTLFTIKANYYSNVEHYEKNNPDNGFCECDYDHNRWESIEE